MSNRVLAIVSIVGTLVFMALVGLAMSLYPGGTWYDRRAVGHSFTHNFLCDLMQTRAVNGVENPLGSVVTQVAMVIILIALAAFFVQVARLGSPEARVTKITRRAGVFACVLGCSVPLVQADLFFAAHLVVVVAAFIPALVATVAAFVICLKSPQVPLWIRGLALLTIGAATLDFLLYVLGYGMAWGLVPSVGRQLLNLSLPVIQRIATLALLAWVVALSVHRLWRSRAA
jgi:hypothetical protein